MDPPRPPPPSLIQVGLTPKLFVVIFNSAVRQPTGVWRWSCFPVEVQQQCVWGVFQSKSAGVELCVFLFLFLSRLQPTWTACSSTSRTWSTCPVVSSACWTRSGFSPDTPTSCRRCVSHATLFTPFIFLPQKLISSPRRRTTTTQTWARSTSQWRRCLCGI